MGCGIVLAVLCGLPGSGKSCLAQLINEKYEQSSLATVCVVCYDYLLHRSLAEQLIPATSDVTRVAHALSMVKELEKSQHNSKWKEYREFIVNAVDALVCEKLDKNLPNNKLDTNTIVAQLKDEIGIRVVSSSSNRFLFIIDDNMYFKSMRFDYYKLARKYNIGFCQIHVQCPLDVAIERNRTREDLEKVEETVIHNMNIKFETPDPIEYSWEAMSISTGSDNDHFLSFWPKLDCFLQTAFDNPVLSRLDDEDEKAASREECARSVLHQVDKILRKLVSNAMKKNGGTKSEAERLNGARQILLNDIKTGELMLNEDLKRRIEGGQIEDFEIDLNHFLNEAFQNKLANKT